MGLARRSWECARAGESQRCGRFAPSTTGRAHLGTLLSALLAWCDVRHYGGRLLLRLEDLDPARSRPDFAASLQADLAWLGLDFDQVAYQSAHHGRHLAALAQLAAQGSLYACSCSRRQLRASQAPPAAPGQPVQKAQATGASASKSAGSPAPVGGGDPPDATHRCAATPVDARSWTTTDAPLRLRLGAAARSGDPIVRRRDGAIAYVLASVVDDAAAGVTHVVRGRDLAPLVPVQAALFRALGARPPLWRHHMLLCSRRGRKLAKLHGDGCGPNLAAQASPSALCGWLAWAAGLRPMATPTTPAALVADYSWQQLRRADRCLPPSTT